MTRKRGIFWCAGLFAALIVYGATVCLGVSWGDSGEVQLIFSTAALCCGAAGRNIGWREAHRAVHHGA